jgi:hypothetical protein
LCGSHKKDPRNEAGQAVQAMRYEWWGFFVAGDCPAELPVMNYQVKPDRFLSYFLQFLFLSISQIK